MLTGRIKLALAVFLTLLGQTAFAADITAKSTADGMLITITGEIVADDDDRFNQLVGGFSGALVVLSSRGGNLIEGLNIGLMIRTKRFATMVLDRDECASVCALMWLAGTARFMAGTSRIGFHAAYRAKDGSISGTGNALVGAYLATLGLPYDAIMYATASNPEDMTWLTMEQAQKNGIAVTLLKPTPTTPTPEYRSAITTAGRIGPSYECSRADTPAALFICADADLSKIDLEMVQPYYVLRHQVGPTGWKALLVEAINFSEATAAACGIAAGIPPDDKAALKNCMAGAYTRQRAVYMARLALSGLQEAQRPIEQHIALQSKLKALGFLSATDKIDGIYGNVTRSAITNWQTRLSLLPTGILDDADAARLLGTAPPIATADSLPTEAAVAALASQMQREYSAGGISGIIASIQACYSGTGSNQAAVRNCMLYDMAAYLLDRGFTESMGIPAARQPYFTDAAMDERRTRYAGVAFGGWNDAARRYLGASKTVLARSVPK